MSSQQVIRPYHESDESSSYHDLSKRYAEYWGSAHFDDYSSHYTMVQTQFGHWMKWLRDKQKIDPQDGAMVICGPGFDCASRDFSHNHIDVTLKDHPLLIISDFSRSVLFDAYDSLRSASPGIERNIRLVRRDFSHRLSANLDHMLLDKIDNCLTLEEWTAFMRELEFHIDLEAVANHSLTGENTSSHEGNPEVLGVTKENNLAFPELLKEKVEVRFIVANLLLDGMFAVTEMAFRDKLLEIAKRNPDVMTEDRVDADLKVWHILIRELNTEVTQSFIQSGLTQNEKAHMFAVIAGTTSYPQGDMHNRINYDEMRVFLEKKKIGMKISQTWEMMDAHEDPPHKHNVIQLKAFRNDNLRMNGNSLQYAHGPDTDSSDVIPLNSDEFGSGIDLDSSED